MKRLLVIAMLLMPLDASAFCSPCFKRFTVDAEDRREAEQEYRECQHEKNQCERDERAEERERERDRRERMQDDRLRNLER